MQYNKIIYIFLAFGCFSCTGINDQIPLSSQLIDNSDDTVSYSLLIRNPNLGLVFKKDEPFNGVSVKHYDNGQIAESVRFEKGKKVGLTKKWFTTGILSYAAEYVDGKLDGESRTWWNDGTIRSTNHFSNGKVNGLQTQNYRSGALFKELNYVNGKEQGMQKAWRENGKIYNNYEAKNGRFFGLRRSTLCYELEDEIVQYKD
jgi:antitoxin component YwqK of YwqJK toxin-antitoxin module